MSFFIYATQAEAMVEAEAVNTAYAATIVDMRDGIPVVPQITTAWAFPIECVEGWALPRPPDAFVGLITSTNEVEVITRVEN